MIASNELQKELERLEKVSGRLFDRKLGELSSLYASELDAVRREALLLIRELSGESITAARLAKVRRSLSKRDAPLKRFWGIWEQWLDDIIDNTEEYQAILGTSLSVSKPLAHALKGVWPSGKNPTGIIGGFYLLDQASKEKTADIVTRSIIGSVPRRLSAKALAEASKISLSKGGQRMHDATMVFSRQVQSLNSDRYDFFLYTGPDDKVTRPFCNKHVDKIRSKVEIDQLRNGQIDDVFLSGGGYRCRHVWRPVKKEWYSQSDWDRLIESEN